MDTAEESSMSGEAAPRHFLKFQEVNEWEGETWNFWLLVDGNEDEVEKLRRLLDTASEAAEEDDVDGLPFELGTALTPEWEVDVLVKHAEGDYMPDHTKVTGTFTCPDSYHMEKFYKGGVVALFEGGESNV
jgi:hypothetical protein